MKIKISTASPDALDRETLILGFFSDERPPRGYCGLVDWRLNGMISAEIAAGQDLRGLSGKARLRLSRSASASPASSSSAGGAFRTDLRQALQRRFRDGPDGKRNRGDGPGPSHAGRRPGAPETSRHDRSPDHGHLRRLFCRTGASFAAPGLEIPAKADQAIRRSAQGLDLFRQHVRGGGDARFCLEIEAQTADGTDAPGRR